MLLPIEGDCSCWYEIYNTDEGIAIGSHEQNWIWIRDLNSDSPNVQVKIKGLNLPPFQPLNGNRTWGFGELISQIPARRPNWISWQVAFPKLPRGFMDQTLAFACTYNIDLLLQAMNRVVNPVTTQDLQLLTIPFGFRTRPEMAGASFGACVTPQLSRFLATRVNGLNDVWSFTYDQSVGQSMFEAWKRLVGRSTGFAARDFVCRFRTPHFVFLDVPGNACGLGADGSDMSERQGNRYWELVPHNLDGAIHQLTLLTGLAKIHEIARSEGY